MKLALRAIVCIRSAHYVTYACIPSESGSCWVFSNSMAESCVSPDGVSFECVPGTVAVPGVRAVYEAVHSLQEAGSAYAAEDVLYKDGVRLVDQHQALKPGKAANAELATKDGARSVVKKEERLESELSVFLGA